MEQVKATIHLLQDSRWDLVTAGAVDAAIWTVVVLAVAIPAIVYMRRFRLALGLYVALILVPLTAIPAGVRGSVNAACELVNTNAKDLKLLRPTGLVLLMPIMQTYVGDDEAEAEKRLAPMGRGSRNVAVFVEDANRRRIIDELTTERVAELLATIRKEVRIPETPLPASLVQWLLDKGQHALAHDLPSFHAILNTDLKPLDDGSLPLRIASRQAGEAFLGKYGPALAERQVAEYQWPITGSALAVFVLLLGAAFVLRRRLLEGGSHDVDALEDGRAV